jgi:AraC-like DNA-binding protein/mannose-6-phosphate isomerase-like protein (cupin superfamily)
MKGNIVYSNWSREQELTKTPIFIVFSVSSYRYFRRLGIAKILENIAILRFYGIMTHKECHKEVFMERIERFDANLIFLTHAISDETYYRSHRHPEYEIFYIREARMKGEGIIRRVDGHEYTVYPGGLLLIPPHVSHDHRVLSSQPYDHLSIHFLPEMLGKTERSLFQFLFNPQQAYYMDSSGTAGLFADSLLGCMDMDRQILGRAIKYRILSILTHLYQLQGMGCGIAPQRVSQNKRVRDMLDFIWDNLYQPLSLVILSRRFNMNMNHLNDVFSKETGITVERYIRIQRLYIARQNIGQGMQATEAAYSVGFNDYSNFFRAYKAFFGSAPTAGQISNRWPVDK